MTKQEREEIVFCTYDGEIECDGRCDADIEGNPCEHYDPELDPDNYDDPYPEDVDDEDMDDDDWDPDMDMDDDDWDDDADDDDYGDDDW